MEPNTPLKSEDSTAQVVVSENTSSTPTSSTPLVTPAPKGSKNVLWIVLGVLGVMLLLCCGCCGLIVLTNPSSLESSSSSFNTNFGTNVKTFDKNVSETMKGIDSSYELSKTERATTTEFESESRTIIITIFHTANDKKVTKLEIETDGATSTLNSLENLSITKEVLQNLTGSEEIYNWYIKRITDKTGSNTLENSTYVAKYDVSSSSVYSLEVSPR